MPVAPHHPSNPPPENPYYANAYIDVPLEEQAGHTLVALPVHHSSFPSQDGSASPYPNSASAALYAPYAPSAQPSIIVSANQQAYVPYYGASLAAAVFTAIGASMCIFLGIGLGGYSIFKLVTAGSAAGIGIIYYAMLIVAAVTAVSAGFSGIVSTAAVRKVIIRLRATVGYIFCIFLAALVWGISELIFNLIPETRVNTANYITSAVVAMLVIFVCGGCYIAFAIFQCWAVTMQKNFAEHTANNAGLEGHPAAVVVASNQHLASVHASV